MEAEVKSGQLIEKEWSRADVSTGKFNDIHPRHAGEEREHARSVARHDELEFQALDSRMRRDETNALHQRHWFA